MNKADNLRNPTSCLNRAEPDEPLFILRAKDPLAAQAVRHWATMSDGNHEPEKIAQALKAAEEMERWRAQRYDAAGNPHPTAAPCVSPHVADHPSLCGHCRTTGHVHAAWCNNAS